MEREQEIDHFELFSQWAHGVADGVNRLADALTWPSCWTCRYAFIAEDMSVGIWPYVDDCAKNFGAASVEQYQDDPNYDEEYLADACGCYQPDLRSIANVW